MPTILTIALKAVGDVEFSLTGFTVDTSFSVGGQEGSPRGMFFNTDGTLMFVVGAGSDAIYQYTLSSGFDLSTASFDSVSVDVSSQDSSPEGIAFNADGTKMFVVGQSTDAIYQYSLSTGFDLSTASFDSVSVDVSGQETAPLAIAFNADGTKMFVVGAVSDSVHQYTLSSGFDLSTASFDSESFDVSSQDGAPQGISFSPDGTKMFIIGSGSDSVHQYTLSSGFDLSTASFDSESFDVSSQETTPRGVTFNSDGTKMFIIGSDSTSVHQYSK